MSRLNELIQELCPDGVVYKKLEELGTFFSGLTGKSKDDFKDGNAKFITYRNVYSNPSLNMKIEDKVKIRDNEIQHIVKYGDILFTGSSETPDECGMSSVVTTEPDEKLYLNSFCFGLHLYNVDYFNIHYLKHVLRSNDIRKQIKKTASGVTRYNVSKKRFAKVCIPIPPLDVQNEIVRILDTFTSHAAELQAELQARKEQYEYYRNKLLTFDKDDKNVKWVKLKEYAEIGTGSSNTQDELSIGLYPFFVRSQIVRRNNEYEFDETAIITSGDGVGVGKIFHYVEGKYALHQRAYRIHVLNEKIIPKFLFHYMRCEFYNYITKNAYTSSVTSIRKPMLLNFPIPILSMSEQQRIVSILDKFEALVNDLTEGLPAEIAAVQEQYEYYRNKLLTFKDVGTYHGASST